MSTQLTKKEIERSLRLISSAWGRRQTGYVFFPYIDREEQKASGIRRAGFHEGPAFEWPKDRQEIVDYLHTKQGMDVYWTTSIFEFPSRNEAVAKTEHALWADLDEVDPDTLLDYPPTIAWESSPDRYQCLWVAQTGNFEGASDPGNENQRMTYLIGADASGWDAAQLLRIPGWVNHKPEYKNKKGEYPKGKILWSNGRRYLREEFSDLPEVKGSISSQVSEALESDIDGVDRLKVIADVKLKLNRTAREILFAKDAEDGDKSEKLWYLHRCLADAGLSIAEIVAVTRETAWNKFAGRHDELKVLISEASKAIASRSDETIAKLDGEEDEEDDEVRPDPQRLGFLLKNIKRPKYIIQGILSEGACGFIAGEPKCYKSWVGLDLALSVSTGADFLGQFRVLDPGPVLYIQEEDPAPTLKNRTAKIWVNKAVDKIELIKDEEDAGVYWLPPDQEQAFDPNVNAYVQNGFTISSEVWQLWLDETLAKGMTGADGTTMPYKVLIIDTLMMVAGDVDENRAQEMTTRVFKPLKVLSRKHNVAVLVIHHMGKSDKTRPGQRMLGSVANHAWAEDSLYLTRSGMKDIRIDTESKTIPSTTYRMTNIHNLEWQPRVETWREEEEEATQQVYNSAGARSNIRGKGKPRRRSKPGEESPVIKVLRENGVPMTTKAIADATGLNRSSVHRTMARYLDQEVVDLNQQGQINTWELIQK